MSKSNASYFILPTNDMESSSLQTNQKKTTKKLNYGSLKQESLTQTANKFVINYEHKLQPGDTLLGISLKYNLPIETIKRANRLWSNELTFKDKLIIPLDKEKISELNLSMNGQPQSSSDSVNVSKPDEKAEYKDFLNKFDSFINESKMKLKNFESQSSSLAIAEYLNNTQKYNNNNNSYNDNSFREDDVFVRNDSLFRSNGNLRGVKNQTESSSLSLSSMSSSNLSGVLQRSSNSNLTSNGHYDLPEQVTTPSKKNPNCFESNYNLISSTDRSSDRAKLAKENLQKLEREKDNLYEL